MTYDKEESISDQSPYVHIALKSVPSSQSDQTTGRQRHCLPTRKIFVRTQSMKWPMQFDWRVDGFCNTLEKLYYMVRNAWGCFGDSSPEGIGKSKCAEKSTCTAKSHGPSSYTPFRKYLCILLFLNRRLRRDDSFAMAILMLQLNIHVIELRGVEYESLRDPGNDFELIQMKWYSLLQTKS